MAKILVVEDTEFYIKSLTDILEEGGHEVVAAMNSSEALLAIRKGVPDLIFMDIQMPGMDGHHTIKVIKMDKKLKHVPVIVFSSLSAPDLVALSGEVGAVLHLTKNTSKEKILYTVEEALEIAKRQKPTE